MSTTQSKPHIRAIRAATVEQAFLDTARAQLERSLHKITHCVNQLTDEQLWHRPRPEMNSIANLLLHLSGNLRQWIVSGAGGAPDRRDRQAEFDDRSMMPKAQALSILAQTIAECRDTLAKLDVARLLEIRHVQGGDVQLLPAVSDTVAHLQGHVQEIIHMTRALLGPAYRFDFTPGEREQRGRDLPANQ